MMLCGALSPGIRWVLMPNARVSRREGPEGLFQKARQGERKLELPSGCDAEGREDQMSGGKSTNRNQTAI